MIICLGVDTSTSTSRQAWLESEGGERTFLSGTCTIGRSPTNQVVLPREKVSRKHAMINTREESEYWLVDLGSSNGTYLNGRRITQACRLNDRDRLEIGGQVYVFRQASAAGPTPDVMPAMPDTDKTIQDIKSVPCWLLVADIQGSTEFIQKLPPEEAPHVAGRWLNQCRVVIERHGGSINKFLGDGFLAYWTEDSGIPEQVTKALDELRVMQAKGAVRFRLVVHYGKVFLGGAASLGEESLLGNEVNFVFRMEKLAGSLGAACLISEPANEHFHTLITTEEECRKTVPGFDGEFLFYRPVSTAPVKGG